MQYVVQLTLTEARAIYNAICLIHARKWNSAGNRALAKIMVGMGFSDEQISSVVSLSFPLDKNLSSESESHFLPFEKEIKK